MINYTPLYAQMENTVLASWLDHLPAQVAAALDESQHGRLPEWRTILNNLPSIKPSQLNLGDGVIVGQPDDLPEEQLRQHRTENQRQQRGNEQRTTRPCPVAPRVRRNRPGHALVSQQRCGSGTVEQPPFG